MPLFRIHHEGLKESLLATVVVKDRSELLGHILNTLSLPASESMKAEIKFKIEPNTNKDSNFNKRMGWYKQVVLLSLNDEPYHLVGFLSEPFNG